MRTLVQLSAKAIVAGLACALISACSAGSGARVQSVSAPQAAPATEIDTIVDLLEAGKTGAAKKRINAALKQRPNNPALMVLRDSITRKPQELLGPESYPYTVRTGDTMASLAQRFLGNRLKFYQLSRYNEIDTPSSLKPGQVLNIPGRPAPQKAIERPRSPAATAPREKSKPLLAQPAAPARPAANPAAALQARSAGLAALNAGQPSRAVSLLSRAAALDPGSAVIARDLARARRIAATVGSK